MSRRHTITRRDVLRATAASAAAAACVTALPDADADQWGHREGETTEVLYRVWLNEDPTGLSVDGLHQWMFVACRGEAVVRFTDGRATRRGPILRYDPWRTVYVSDRIPPARLPALIGRCLLEIIADHYASEAA